MNLRDITTGEDFERAFFGVSHLEVRQSGVVPRTVSKKPTLRESIEMLYTIQPQIGWDPKNPKTDLSEKVFRFIHDRLPKYLRPGLRLYCGVGTHLDTVHHADGLFDTNSGHRLRFDLTLKVSPRHHCGVFDFRKIDFLENNFDNTVLRFFQMLYQDVK